jgi:hypothetical protein
MIVKHEPSIPFDSNHPVSRGYLGHLDDLAAREDAERAKVRELEGEAPEVGRRLVHAAQHEDVRRALLEHEPAAALRQGVRRERLDRRVRAEAEPHLKDTQRTAPRDAATRRQTQVVGRGDSERAAVVWMGCWLRWFWRSCFFLVEERRTGDELLQDWNYDLLRSL